MSWERPKLREIVERNRALVADKVRSAGPDTVAGLELRRTDPDTMAVLIGMAEHEQHAHLAEQQKQHFLRTATLANLEAEAAEYGIFRKAAAKAGGSVVFSGDDGSIIPAGAIMRRGTDTARFITLAEVVFSGGTATASVQAETAGADGNTAADAKLYLTSPVLGVTNPGTVGPDGLTGGADIESDDDLRYRVYYRKQNPGPGFSPARYAQLAMFQPGVTRAYVWPNGLGAGTVTIAPLFDNHDSGDPTPSAAEVAAVQAYFDAVGDNNDPINRGCCCVPTVFALTAVPVNFTISLTPPTDLVKAAVQAELEDLFRQRDSYGRYEIGPGSTLLGTHIGAAISAAAGEYDHELTSPTGDVASDEGEILVMGAITWS